jgi:tRNA threonylcarbamoyladenosine biosynthesis protein TsaB
MKLLALDTATEACTAGLLAGDELLWRFELAPRRHAALVLGMMDELLVEAGIGIAELDAIGFGQGPGAFTGLRIAASVAQGVAFATDVPVVAVSSLAATAQQLADSAGVQRCIAAFDARMGELYMGIYELGNDGLVTALQQDRLLAPGQAPAVTGGSWFGAGSGWKAHEEALKARYGELLSGVEPDAYPHGAAVARLAARGLSDGKAVPAERALPVYLRNRVAEVPTSDRQR